MDPSLQLTTPTSHFKPAERLGLGLAGLGFVALVVAASGAGPYAPAAFLLVSVGLISVGSLVYFRRHLRRPAGIQNEGLAVSGTTARGALGWIAGIVFTGFYIVLYWVPDLLADLVPIFDPLSYSLRGSPADRWFMYGFFYTMAVLLMGVRAIFRYRHSRYQIVRTLSVMFFQLGFAFLIPAFLLLLNEPEFYFSYFWPLDYDLLWPGTIDGLLQSPGRLGAFMVVWGAVLTFVATPVLTYFFGKRWYCSWVCGCGGLAETLGDPWRHLSDKSLSAWRIERWVIHSVLAFVTATTLLLWINSATGGGLLGGFSGTFARTYGFFIGAVFAGVVGVGFYPIMGSRVWCRFGCPMAAILGVLQKYFSRFRITTNGGQCISCGNCSKYCEMGIDVRWYAQRGQNMVRASCVGCGVCSEVCPRGVLRLENGPQVGRYNGPVLIDREHVSVLPDEALS